MERAMNQKNDLININDENTRTIVLEQYKMLVDSINKINDTREFSNGFWIAANSVGISALAYLRDTYHVPQNYKSVLLMALIVLGIIFSLSWLSYLANIKKAVEVRSDLLMDIEQRFPIPMFTKVFSLADQKAGRATLTNKEMFVPSLFLFGYVVFAVLLLFYPQEVMATMHKS
jgi:hypothetical protein